MTRSRRLLIVILLALIPSCAVSVSRGEDPGVLVYLVRHAERAEDGTDDPHISEAGQERAALLAEMLRDAGITHIHSTDYYRTRETVGPLSTEIGVGIESYDPRDLRAFSSRLKGMPGRHLVVGHSNTTPALVEALGGDPSGSIESMEYDRLYLVWIQEDRVRTVLIRFGARFQG